MLEGHLVDLVPRTDDYVEIEAITVNAEAGFWSNAGSRPLVTQAAYHAFVDSSRERDADNPMRTIFFGIRTKDGTPIGRMKIRSLPAHLRQNILGFLIGDPVYWGQGRGTDALLLAVQYCFDWLDARKIWLGTMGWNVRVLRQMEKVGFVQELRQRDGTYGDGQWCDMVVFARLREDWPGYVAEAARLKLHERAAQIALDAPNARM